MASRTDRPSGAGSRSFAQQLEPTYAAPPQAPAAAPPTPDPIAQLKDLAALKEQGILTEEEFAAQKAKILGS